mgnify:CR=1 FL=1
MIQLDNMTIRKAYFDEEYRNDLLERLFELTVKNPESDFEVRSGREISGIDDDVELITTDSSIQ